MKKIIFPFVCICFVVTVMLSFVYAQSMPPANETADRLGATAVDTPTPGLIESIGVTADLSTLYSDYQSLVADAEIIVTGTAKGINSFCDAQGLICSIVDFGVERVLKGDVDDQSLGIYITGGIMPKKEFLTFHAEKLKDKFTPEVFDKEYNKVKSADKIECVFMGVENIKAGDQLLLFLTYDEMIGQYRITGSSYNGKFYYEASTESFYRENDGEKSMSIHDSELRELLEKTPDNSKNLKMEKQNRKPVKKDGERTERDPAFDKYKGN